MRAMSPGKAQVVQVMAAPRRSFPVAAEVSIPRSPLGEAHVWPYRGKMQLLRSKSIVPFLTEVNRLHLKASLAYHRERLDDKSVCLA